MKLTKSTIIRILISLGLLIFILNRIGPTKILQTVASLNCSYLPIIIGLYGITLIIGGFKLWILLRAVTKTIPVARVLIYSMLSWSVGLFTPGKVGEFSAVYFLRREGLEIGKGIGIVLIDKFITTSTLIICSGLGMFILFDIKYIILFLFVSVAGLGAVYLLTFFSDKIGSEKLSTWLRDLRFSLRECFQNNKGLLLINSIMTLGKWCITGLAFYMVFASLGSSYNVLLIIIISMTIIIINIIPVTLNGLGLKEIAAVYFFGMINVPQDVAVVSSLFFSLLAYAVGVTLIISFGSYFHKN
jgi:uncharacterized membrane protein YbhN (UPF0104 family)